MTLRLLIGLCGLVAIVDVLQVPLLGKGAGAVGGALVYGVSAVLLSRGLTQAAWLLAAMPVIPVAVFTGVLGDEMRDKLVDAPMVGVFVLQLLIAGLAAQLLSASQRGSSQGDAS